MEKRIIHPNDDGTISVLTPVLECGLSVEEIARKDVPANKPYFILNVGDLPYEHREYMDAWEVDFSSPDGYGIGHDAWYAEQATKEQA